MEEKVKSVDMRIKAALNEAGRKNQRFKERKSFFLLMEMKLREFEMF
jgi:outer membrane murein-binding lipoprotein Lpp